MADCLPDPAAEEAYGPSSPPLVRQNALEDFIVTYRPRKGSRKPKDSVQLQLEPATDCSPSSEMPAVRYTSPPALARTLTSINGLPVCQIPEVELMAGPGIKNVSKAAQSIHGPGSGCWTWPDETPLLALPLVNPL